MPTKKLSKLHAARFSGFREFLRSITDLVSNLSPEAKAAAQDLFQELVQMFLTTALKAQPKQLAAYEERARGLGLDWSQLLQLAQFIAGLIKGRTQL